jgi:hypothetical protein
MIRYVKITDIDDKRYILRVTHETPNFISGIEVDEDGDEVVPRGLHPTIKRPYHNRERKVLRDAIKKIVEMQMNPRYATLEVVPTVTHARKRAAELDADIAAALALQPVEGLQIPADSRRELNRFWRSHPALRKGCVSKYGFDPINEEHAYWRFGLAEPGHKDTLRAVRKNGNVFSLPHVKRWMQQELEDA